MKRLIAIFGLAAALGPAGCRRADPAGDRAARERALAQLRELETILKSRNDNDPRLDKDFNGLSPFAKEMFRNEYRNFPTELRNERGTLVYLLGKNIENAADWEFMRKVAAEPPCMSLSDCSKKSSEPAGMGDDVTLAYPSLVALKASQAALEKDPKAAGPRAVVDAGLKSKMPAVVRLSANLDRRFPR